jgi:tripartite-type tricarboxylate transporter receptor subunit TctC
MKEIFFSKLTSRRTAIGGLLGWSSAGWSLAAENFYRVPKTIIVPLPIGSLTDSLARKFAELISESTHSPVNVENIPGASGAIAVNQLLSRPRDGSTLLLGSSGVICVTPLLIKGQLKFDPQIDLVPVCTTATAVFFLFTAKTFPANNLKELKQFYADGGEQPTYAANAVGCANHLAGEEILQRLGIKGTHIPYNNTSQAIVDVAQGRVQLGIFGYSSISAFLEVNRVKLLCNLSDIQLDNLSQTSSVAAQGFGNFNITGWSALFVANGTPQSIIQEHERLIKSLYGLSDIFTFAKAIGSVATFRGHADSKVFVNDEILRYKELVHKYKIVPI